MPTATIHVVPYAGPLKAPALLSRSQTLPMCDFGAPTSGTLFDTDNSFGQGDGGITTFNGAPVTYVGSGTATPGVEVLGVIVPLGLAMDVVAFEAGGTNWFHYPNGAPAAIGQAAIVLDITEAPYDGLTPISFCAGALIETPTCLCPVEDLKAGDEIIDVTGVPVRIVWTGHRTVNLSEPMSTERRERLAPVRIWADSFGPGRPFRDLFVSPHHRVLVQGYPTQVLFGLNAALAPAKALIGSMARQELDTPTVSYHHLLCERHCIVPSNGLPTATMLLNEVGLRTLRPGDLEEIRLLFPALLDCPEQQPMSPAHALLSTREGRVAAVVAASGL